MELHARERPHFDRGHDRASVVDGCGDDSAASSGSAAKLWAKYTSALSAPSRKPLGRVAASVFQPMCGTRGAAPRRTPPLRAVEPLTALLALPEEELHPDADSRDGSAVRDALAQGLVEGVPARPAAALDVADPAISASGASRTTSGSVVTIGRTPARASAEESERRFPAP